MTRRSIELALLPAALLAAIALPVPLLSDQLPDPLATHWSAGGTPDGSLDPTAVWLAVTGAWLVLWAVLAALARRAPVRAGGRLPEAVPILGIGGFLAGLMALTVIANDGAATWRDADHVGLLAVLPALAGGLACAGAALWLERGRPYGSATRAAGAGAGAETIGLAAGERAVWVGHASSPRLAVAALPVALALATAGVLVGGAPGPALVAGAVLVALALAWASTVRVTVSARGVLIAFGPWGVPARRMPADQIERAEATEIEPLRWGGWGYRWAGRGRSAVVVRRGPGLVLDLRGGRRFAVTVDDPEVAAGLLNDLVRRRATG